MTFQGVTVFLFWLMLADLGWFQVVVAQFGHSSEPFMDDEYQARPLVPEINVVLAGPCCSSVYVLLVT